LGFRGERLSDRHGFVRLPAFDQRLNDWDVPIPVPRQGQWLAVYGSQVRLCIRKSFTSGGNIAVHGVAKRRACVKLQYDSLHRGQHDGARRRHTWVYPARRARHLRLSDQAVERHHRIAVIRQNDSHRDIAGTGVDVRIRAKRFLDSGEVRADLLSVPLA
jgi:hypothetical protein